VNEGDQVAEDVDGGAPKRFIDSVYLSDGLEKILEACPQAVK
jgi:hypothetical protein